MLCKICGNELVGRHTRYCSRACCIKGSTLARAARRPARSRVECETCFNRFTPRQRGQKYCCRACGMMALALREMKQAHGSNHNSQLELPPSLVLELRAENVRLQGLLQC